jgi:hypothetical protein
MWCSIVSLAVEITAWMQMLALSGVDATAHGARRWEPKRLRHRLFAVPAALARTGRRALLHLSDRAPWVHLVNEAITALRALAEPG